MQYFNKFPRAFYIFGDQEAQGTGKISSELVQDISAYSDVLDRIADNVAFHTFYDIQEGTSTHCFSLKNRGSRLVNCE